MLISQKGTPSPLGVTPTQNGINFAIFSTSSSVSLLLFYPEAEDPFAVFNLDPSLHKTDDVWHIFIPNIAPPFEYVYEVLYQNNKVHVHDPYTKALSSSNVWGSSSSYNPKGRFFIPTTFDWQNTQKPTTPLKDWIIYEMHLRGFTQDSSSKVDKKGTFLGMIEKIPHLVSLGVNAVELLPVFEFNETEFKKKGLVNFWGYSTVNFFCPMQRYSTGNQFEDPILECKTLIRELHKNGIMVILDVVYNHTAEGGEDGPILSFKGLSQETYYCQNKEGKFADYTGTGNTFNCNHPIVKQLILDSLTYWVEEMHIDAFRFDLASIFCRSSSGDVLKNPPILDEIRKSQKLQNTLFIAEAWDAAGLYQVGSFPGGKRWSEWNGRYRDTVRKFIKGTDWQVAPFMQALCGSQDLYSRQSPLKSINFITVHDGYTLKDLVSYQNKHNEANKENNADGANDNESWNCGAEGISEDKSILFLRSRQMKNFYLALLVSLGVPMLFMGDEYGHTKNGNNNTYCHDNPINWFLWDELGRNQELFHFVQTLIAYRKERKDLFCKANFLSEKDIHWIDAEWRGPGRFVSYILLDPITKKDCLIAFNASHLPISFSIPKERSWCRIIDTALSYPWDCIKEPEKRPKLPTTYLIAPRSALLAEAIP
jgi:glycogen debranching enzyme GlgX